MTTHSNPAAIADAANDTAKAATLSRPRALVPPAIALCVGCVLSIGAYLMTASLENREQQIRFEGESEAWFNHIEIEINHTFSVLRAIAGLYAALQEVEREEFRAFAASASVDEIIITTNAK